MEFLDFYGNYFTIFVSLTIVVIFYIFVFGKNKYILINKLFIIVNSLIILWFLGSLLINFNFIPIDFKLLIQRISYIFGIALGVFILRLANQITKANLERIYKIFDFIALFLALALFTQYFIPNLIQKSDGFIQSSFGFFYYIFIAYFLIGFFVSLLALVSAFKKLEAHKRTQFIYIIVGFTVIYLGIFIYFATTLRLIYFHTLSGYLISFGQFILFYGILNFCLPGVTNFSLAFRSFLNWFLFLVVAFLVFSPFLFFAHNYFNIVLLITLMCLFIPNLKQTIMQPAKSFIMKKYHYLEKLDKLNFFEYINSNIIDDLIKQVYKIIEIKSVAVFYRQSNGKFKLFCGIDYNIKDIVIDLSLYRELNDADLFVNCDEKADLFQNFKDTKILYVLRHDTEGIIGFFLLGEKLKGSFNNEDFKRLSNIRRIIEKKLVLELKVLSDIERSKENYQKYILETTKRFIEIKKEKQLAESVVNFLIRNTDVENAIFFTINQFNDDKKPSYSILYETSPLNLSSGKKYEYFAEFLFSRQEILYFSQVQKLAIDSHSLKVKNTLDLMTKNNISFVIPLIFERLIGFILIKDDKKNQNDYTINDRHIFDLVGYSASLSLQNIKLTEESIMDKLTHCYKKDHFDFQLQEQIFFSIKNSLNFICLMIDVDNFKQINDKFGHVFGDEILVKVSSLLKECLRVNDIVSRWGGEEFAIILTFIELEEARQIAERIRENIATNIRDKANNSITVSIGMCLFDVNGKLNINKIKLDEIGKAFLDKADQALYKAKKNGKNQVVVNEKFVVS